MSKKLFCIKKEKRLGGDFPFFISKHRNKGFRLHKHEYYEIFYVVEGRGYHYIDRYKTLLSKGDIFMINPREVHKFVISPEENLIIINCEFLPSLLDEHMSSLRQMRGFFDFAYLSPFYRSKREKLHLAGKVDVTVRSLLEGMLNEFTSKKSGYQLAIKAELLWLLVIMSRVQELLMEKDNQIDRKRNAILNTLQYIDEHYNEKLQLNEVAKVANMGSHYFCEIFKRITGKTFVEYVNDLRLTKAYRLLKKKDVTISEVCYEVGFSDISHFEHMFRRQTGMSPSKFRKK